MGEEVQGFSKPVNAEGSDEENEFVSVKKSGKKTGGFQGFGLCYPVLKGILKRGYKIPTPIQRKVSY